MSGSSWPTAMANLADVGGLDVGLGAVRDAVLQDLLYARHQDDVRMGIGHGEYALGGGERRDAIGGGRRRELDP